MTHTERKYSINGLPIMGAQGTTTVFDGIKTLLDDFRLGKISPEHVHGLMYRIPEDDSPRVRIIDYAIEEIQEGIEGIVVTEDDVNTEIKQYCTAITNALRIINFLKRGTVGEETIKNIKSVPYEGCTWPEGKTLTGSMDVEVEREVAMKYESPWKEGEQISQLDTLLKLRSTLGHIKTPVLECYTPSK